MGNHLTRHSRPTAEQKYKLNLFFKRIYSKASVDFSSAEIQDIQYAVYQLLERIKTKVNERGIFNIRRIVSSGRMAENTSIWKYDINADNHYLEFDFLADLRTRTCIAPEINPNDCQACRKVYPPVDFVQLGRLYGNTREYNARTPKDAALNISQLFLTEINCCLTSLCDCLSPLNTKMNDNKILSRPAYSESEHIAGCGVCTVDMPTGTLSVNTEIPIVQNFDDPNGCSLIFLWTSKAESLSAPNKLLLHRPQRITSLPIYVDFLSALEALQPSTSFFVEVFRYFSASVGEHDYFVVPKQCNVHQKYSENWRKSFCMAELDAFTTKMSDKHKRCYQVMKYLLGMRWPCSNGYHIKSIVLQHHTKCSDTSNDYTECVFKMCLDLVQSYEAKKLLSYKANHNIFAQTQFKEPLQAKCKQLLNEMLSVSSTDSWGDFVRRLDK